MNASSNSQLFLAQSDPEYSLRGFYEPGFVHLRVNTSEELAEIGRLTDAQVHPAWMSTFLHEYVHFLQDVSTTHGLLNIIHYIEFLKNANKQTRESTNSNFTTPVEISNDHNWNTNKDLKRIYLGNSKKTSRRVNYSDYRFQTESVQKGDGEILSVQKWLVDYHDCGAQVQDSVHFGSIHLKEFMAHAVQEQFDSSTAHDDIPYCLVKMLVEKEAPVLANNINFVIALCDASLMSYHPADLFFETIRRIKASPDWRPGSVESVYEFTLHGLRPEGHDGFDSLFEATANLAVGHFRDALKNDIYKSTVQWFEEIVSQAKAARLGRPGFFSRLIESEGVVSKEFKAVFASLGVPFTTNAYARGYFIPPANLEKLDIQPYYPKAFEAVIRTYYGAHRCSLVDVCAADPNKNITDENCSSQPWVRVNQSELCPYAQMWKTWGLVGKTPRPRTS